MRGQIIADFLAIFVRRLSWARLFGFLLNPFSGGFNVLANSFNRIAADKGKASGSKSDKGNFLEHCRLLGAKIICGIKLS